MTLVIRRWAENGESSGLKQKTAEFWFLVNSKAHSVTKIFVWMYIVTNAPCEDCDKSLHCQLGTWDQSQRLPYETGKTCKSGSNKYTARGRWVPVSLTVQSPVERCQSLTLLDFSYYFVSWCTCKEHTGRTVSYLTEEWRAEVRASEHRMREGKQVKGARQRLAVAITSKMPTKNSPALQQMLEISLSSPDSLGIAAKHVVNYVYLAPRNCWHLAANAVPYFFQCGDSFYTYCI
jgi:hypothetical protein